MATMIVTFAGGDTDVFEAHPAAVSGDTGSVYDRFVSVTEIRVEEGVLYFGNIAVNDKAVPGAKTPYEVLAGLGSVESVTLNGAPYWPPLPAVSTTDDVYDEAGDIL